MFAKNLGMTVIGTASTEDGIQLVKDAGAHHVFNHRSEGYLDQIKVFNIPFVSAMNSIMICTRNG